MPFEFDFVIFFTEFAVQFEWWQGLLLTAHGCQRSVRIWVAGDLELFTVGCWQTESLLVVAFVGPHGGVSAVYVLPRLSKLGFSSRDGTNAAVCEADFELFA